MGNAASLEKIKTGVDGLDEILGGGLPRGRSVLVCGGPGCGKTLLALHVLVHGARVEGAPGVFVSFEETPEEIIQNTATLGWELEDLVRQGRVYMQHIRVRPLDFVEAGVYDLSGLFAQLEHAMGEVGAKRIILDSIENVFSGFENQGVLRSEMVRLFDWLKERGATALVTGERGEHSLTRHGLEEYVSDCVVFLDNRVENELGTRRLRVVKYRGSSHGADEFPFLITSNGLSVFPITAVSMRGEASAERVSTGIADLDAMFEGKGYYRGSSVLVTGSAGTGKSTLAAHFASAACARGEIALYVASEESAPQIIRNMASIGLDLRRWVAQGLLHFHTVRPTQYGLEMHLDTVNRLARELRPGTVVLDPISSFGPVGSTPQIRSMLARLVDHLQSEQAVTFMTYLVGGDQPLKYTDVGISSLADVWIALRAAEQQGERVRELGIVKSRGMAHSLRIRELRFAQWGVELADA